MVMKYSLYLIFCLLRNAFSGNRRFLRLSFGYKKPKKIFFWDKHLNKLFFLYSRGKFDSGVADQVYTHEEYKLSGYSRSSYISEKYKKILLKGYKPLIIDCGGNIGVSSKYFAEIYPESIVACIEPDINNINLARKNCSRNSNIHF